MIKPLYFLLNPSCGDGVQGRMKREEIHTYIYIYISLLLIRVVVWQKPTQQVKLLSRVRLFVTPWTVAYQAPPSIEFSRQVYWSGLPFPSPGDLPDPGIEPWSPALQGRCFTL